MSQGSPTLTSSQLHRCPHSSPVAGPKTQCSMHRFFLKVSRKIMIIYVILLSWIISEDTPGALVASIHLQYWSRRIRIQKSFWAGGWLSLPAPSPWPQQECLTPQDSILTSKHLERHLGSCRHSRLCCPRRKHRTGGRRSLPQDPTPRFQMEKSNYPQVVATKPRGTLRRRDRIPTSPDVCLPWKVLMWSSASGVRGGSTKVTTVLAPQDNGV